MDKLEEFEQSQESKHSTLFKKIESLLPGATTAGLARAYTDMKESFDKPIMVWHIVFFASVGTMLGLTLLTFNFQSPKDLTTTLTGMVYKLPLYAPLIWIAIYSSKRRSESQRLRQEYAHKESFAQSYDKYKRQIDELGQDDKAMLLKLIESSVDTISHNASSTLDSKHGDGTPLEKSVQHVSDLKKIFKS